MTTRKALAPLLGALLAAGLLTGCGEDESRYCDALQERQELFAEDGTGLGLLRNLESMSELRDDAPADLKDEWQTVLGALSGLAEAIADAGVKPEDFVAGKPPAGVDEAARKQIAAAASRVTEPDVVEAFTGIDQQAKDVCKLQLGL